MYLYIVASFYEGFNRGGDKGGQKRGWRSGGRGSGDRGQGVWKDWGAKLIFFLKKKSEKVAHNNRFRPFSHIKVHYGKHASLCGLFCHTTHVMYGTSKISFSLIFLKRYQLTTKRRQGVKGSQRYITLATCADPEGGAGGLDPLKNHNLAMIVLIPCKITKLPSQHSMLGHHRPAGDTPFKWRFAGGPMMTPFSTVKF